MMDDTAYSLFAEEQDADSDALSVYELAFQIKRVLEADPILSDVAVRGEISNFKAHTSGHLYFTLKDESAQIRCCLWRKNALKLPFRPADGHRVIASGFVDFYNARGDVNFICDSLQFDGRGALYEAFEELKRELAAEGLFDPERKKPLPPLPRKIGLITSATGAVAHDVITVLRRRWPIATLVLIPAMVQGFAAAPDLVRALGWAEAVDDLDLVIMARGGGSAEDLWCFNDEELARAVAKSALPVVSAIGHETDFTILDFVADLRAPTPSAAAEIVVPDVRQLRAALQGVRSRLYSATAGDIRLARQRLETLRRSRALMHPEERLKVWRTQVAQARTRVQEATRRRVTLERRSLQSLQAQMRALDPQRVLERGYAIVFDSTTGAPVTSTASLTAGQTVRLRLQDGERDARVEN